MKHQSDLGVLLRQWRQRRHMSQLDLAGEAEMSARHLSFLETGRARPSRAALQRLAEALMLPLRETDALLAAAGFSAFRRSLPGEAMAAIEGPLDRVLGGLEPYPAIVIDRYWTIRKANRAATRLLAEVSPALLGDAPNAIRIGLDPAGLGGRIVNFRQWRDHLIERLRQQVRLTGDAALARLLEAALAYPPGRPDGAPATGGPVVPLRLRSGPAILNLISTTTIFGTPVDVEIAELAIEAFYPADENTRRLLQEADET